MTDDAQIKELALTMIVPPMKILTDRRGKVMTDNGVAVICERKHCHLYGFAEIVANGIQCKTCSAGNRRVRDMMVIVENITKLPWTLTSAGNYATPGRKHTLELATSGTSSHRQKSDGQTHTLLVITTSARKIEDAVGSIAPTTRPKPRYQKTHIVYSDAFAENVIGSSYDPTIARALIHGAQMTAHTETQNRRGVRKLQ